jgi:hypothetical protein
MPDHRLEAAPMRTEWWGGRQVWAVGGHESKFAGCDMFLY